MSMIARHTGIEKVTYGVTDLDKAKAFWTDFGLAPVDNAKGYAEFAAQNGASVEVRPADDPALAPPVGADVDATCAPTRTVRSTRSTRSDSGWRSG